MISFFFSFLFCFFFKLDPREEKRRSKREEKTVPRHMCPFPPLSVLFFIFIFIFSLSKYSKNLSLTIQLADLTDKDVRGLLLSETRGV